MMPRMTQSRRPIEPSLASPLLIANIPRTEPMTTKGKGNIRMDTTPQMME